MASWIIIPNVMPFLVEHNLCDFHVTVTVASDAEALDLRLRTHDEENEHIASHMSFVSTESGREL